MLTWKKKVGRNKGICSKAPIGWGDRIVKKPFFLQRAGGYNLNGRKGEWSGHLLAGY